MSVIENALDQCLYKTNNEIIKKHSWNDFDDLAQKFGIWIFGIGGLAREFLCEYGTVYQINGIIDNDIRKQGTYICDILGESFEVNKELKISGVDILAKERKEQVVVLVTSIRYYEDIIQQLNEQGYYQSYALLIMESKDRRLCINGMKEIEYAKNCLKYDIDKNKVLIDAGVYGNHGKCISKVLRKINPNLDIIWVIDGDSCEEKNGFRVVSKLNWKQYIYELETSYIWIYGITIPEFAIKRKEQIYIQTKHWAGITLKAFYFDSKKYIEIPQLKNDYTHDASAIDYIFVGSKFDEETCRSGFRYNGPCIYVGSPRTDVLFKKGIKEKVYDFFGVNKETNLALYAPTFRSMGEKTPFGKMYDSKLDFDLLVDALRKKFGGKWIVALRLHPSVAIESNIYDSQTNNLINVSFYEDSEELVAAADLMITDYSSLMFEPAFIKKPVFLYAPDRKEYVNNERELLLTYEDLPFPIAESNDELKKIILEFNLDLYYSNLSNFLNSYGIHEDGHASERAAIFINSLIVDE